MCRPLTSQVCANQVFQGSACQILGADIIIQRDGKMNMAAGAPRDLIGKRAAGAEVATKSFPLGFQSMARHQAVFMLRGQDMALSA